MINIFLYSFIPLRSAISNGIAESTNAAYALVKCAYLATLCLMAFCFVELIILQRQKSF